jgi:hypothetical protein
MNAPKNQLSKYLSIAASTDLKNREAQPEALTLLQDCENTIVSLVLNGWRASKQVGLPLALNAHFMFLASVRTAISGHPAAIFPTLRTALESACYALLIADDARLSDIWRSRHKSEKNLKDQKKAFSSAVAQATEQASKRDEHMSDFVKAMYEASIDYGGHPNPRAMNGHLQFGPGGVDDIAEFGCLYQDADPRTGMGMIACAEFGVAIAFLLSCPLIGEFSCQAQRSTFAHLLTQKDNAAALILGSPIECGERLYGRFDKE